MRKILLPIGFLLVYALGILVFASVLTLLSQRVFKALPKKWLFAFYFILGLLLAPIPDHGDFEVLAWKLWKKIQEPAAAE